LISQSRGLGDVYKRQWDNFTQSFLQAEYSRKLSSKISFHSSSFFNALNGGYDYNQVGYQNIFLNSKFYGVVTNFNYKDDKLKVDFGLSANSYRRDHLYSQVPNLQYPYGPEFNNHGIKNEISSYLKGAYKLGRLYLSGDLQIRNVAFNYNIGDFPVIRWNFFNPKTGITYEINSNNNLYLSAGLTHREPTRTYLFNGDYYSELLNNEVEVMTDYELGFNHFSKKFQLQSNLFLMKFDKEITPYGGSSSSGVPSSIVIKNSYRSGLEIDFKYKVNNILSVFYNGACNNTKASFNGNYFDHILVPKFNHNFKVSFSKNGFIAELLSKYQSSSYLNVENTYSIPGFIKFDANIGYSEKHSSVMLQFVNLTNQTYFTNGYVLNGDKMLFVNTPLSMFLTLNYKF
jgi:iron complex outermembrane receptor protein